VKQQTRAQEAFRVKRADHNRLGRCKRNLAKRLAPKQWEDQSQPMFRPANRVYEMSGRARGIACGGIGAIATMVESLGLPARINGWVRVLKRHVPYFESDHTMNMVYNILSGGTCLEDIEIGRNDENYMDALSAERIPDPTTEGDFLRRFDTEEKLLALMEAINEARLRVWREQDEAFRARAVIDVDGTIAPTLGECKQGMDMSYKGVWGYAPLIVSLANTREELYMVNRPGNCVSHDGAVEWIDRAITLAKRVFRKVWVRGDTDFSLTANFDRWDDDGVGFVFGMDAMENLVEIAESLGPRAWKRLRRKAKYEIKTEPRQRPENVKEAIVRARGYENQRLVCEDVAEFAYRPTKCTKTYRVVVVCKNIHVERGEDVLFPEIRYFFYITNDRPRTAAEIVAFAHGRCDQENGIEQLKNGVRALRMPTGDLWSNWAYMIIAALAWNVKCWFGLLMPDKTIGAAVVRMEFRRFLYTFMQLPCQLLRTGRWLVYRLLSYNDYLHAFFETFTVLRNRVFT
jgi:hypothetical protein